MIGKRRATTAADFVAPLDCRKTRSIDCVMAFLSSLIEMSLDL